MSKAPAAIETPRRIHPALLTVMFLVSLVVIVNFYSVYSAGVAPIPTPRPTYTALVVAAVETRIVTAVPTITNTPWPSPTRAPLVTRTPTRTPTPIWMRDPASGETRTK